MLGLNSDSFAGQPLASVIDLDTPRMLAPAPDHGCPGTLRHPDGSVRAVLWTQQWLPGDGGLRLLIVHDDGERRALWRQLATAERLAQAGLLTAGAAHEIQNLLTYARLTLEELAPDTKEADTQAAFDDLRTTLHEIRALVAGLRDATRPSRNDEKIGHLQRPLKRAVMLAGHTLRSWATVVDEASDEAELTLPEPHIQQVLLNLLLNAGQAIGRNDTTGLIRVTSERRHDALVIRVWDSGPGIAPGDDDQLFDPHFTTRADGTGMGLYVSRALARAGGGSLTLENRPEGGAVATLVAPLAVPSTPPQRERRTAPRFRADGISGVLEAGELRSPVTVVDFSETGLRLSGLGLNGLEPEEQITLILSTSGPEANIVESDLTLVRRAFGPSGDDLCFRIQAMPAQSRATWQGWLSQAH